MTGEGDPPKRSSFDTLGQLLCLNRDSGEPLYKQLVEQIIDCVDKLLLMPGQMLPSSRELSKILRVSRKTVIRSYDDLASQGYLTTQDGIGTFISRPIGQSPPGASEVQQVTKLSAMARRIMNVPVERLSCAYFPELNNGAPPPDMLPTKHWRRLMLSYSRDNESAGSNVGSEPFGYRPLREAICSYVLRKRGIQCHADQVILFLDAMYSTYAAAQLLIDAGDRVAMEDPGYPYARRCFQLLDAEIFPVPVDEQGLKISHLQNSSRKICAAFVTPSHQDPCGGTMPMSNRAALLDWAEDNQAIVFEDDYDNDFFYGAPPLPALKSLDKRGSVLYFANFFKVLYPLCGVGYLIVPPQLTDVFTRAMTLGANSSPSRLSIHEELTMTAMLNEGILEKHIRYLQTVYSDRRFRLIAALTKHLRDAAILSNVSGGMTLMMEFDQRFSEAFVVQCAQLAGLPLASVGSYYYRETKANQFIISFACLASNKTDEVVSNFARLLSNAP